MVGAGLGYIRRIRLIKCSKLLCCLVIDYIFVVDWLGTPLTVLPSKHAAFTYGGPNAAIQRPNIFPPQDRRAHVVSIGPHHCTYQASSYISNPLVVPSPSITQASRNHSTGTFQDAYPRIFLVNIWCSPGHIVSSRQSALPSSTPR